MAVKIDRPATKLMACTTDEFVTWILKAARHLEGSWS